MTEGEWNIPLPGGTAEYVISLRFRFVACQHNRTDKEKTIGEPYQSRPLFAKFKAEIADPEAVWLLSTPEVDFENAPKTQAKALEVTKNCKTEAEKITAVFNWVSSNIKYDRNLANQLTTEQTGPSYASDPNGKHFEAEPHQVAGYRDLDRVLTSKSGVCLHYAILTAGMLRSVGVPCKVVIGQMHVSSRWKDHAWVVVNPETGSLNKAALGAGNDLMFDVYGGEVPTGWIRLDPTNASHKNTTSNDANYKIELYC